MNYENLNKVIEYIELNLLYDIEYRELAKIVGLSEYSLQRIFVFLTDMSLAEYIRKRRLSKALEELKNSNIKIIDLAIKYNYSSAISFTRTFKQYFGVTPSECRRDNKNYKIYPIIKFSKSNHKYEEITYEIKKIDETIVNCYEVVASRHDDLLYKIRNLYKMYNHKISQIERYGIYKNEDNKYTYLLGTKERLTNTKRVRISAGKYALFNVKNYNQESIVQAYKFIYGEWLKSTNYKLRKDTFDFEYYHYDHCYICVPIR